MQQQCYYCNCNKVSDVFNVNTARHCSHQLCSFCLKQLNQDIYNNVSRALLIIYMPLLMLDKIVDPNMLPTLSMIQIFSNVAINLLSN